MVEKPDKDWMEGPRYTAEEYSSMGHSWGMVADAARDGEDVERVGDFGPFGGMEAARRHLEQLDFEQAPPEGREAYNMMRHAERAIDRERDDDDRER